MHQLKYNYNLTEASYVALLVKQNGLCAICGGINNSGRRFTALAVDHCHVTRRVRGLLCNRCNRVLGLFDDNATLLEKALKYLAMSH